MAVNLVGFDSAWADNPGRPGAICAVRLADGVPERFDVPRQADFAAARTFIGERHRPGDLTLVAIDQPTIVPNMNGARPVDRAVASLMSFSGGGIQPAYRSKATMFGDGAPIWRFLADLGFTDDPEAACRATSGGFVMEAFPALAVLGLNPSFTAAPRCGPRYNPGRPTFLLAAWIDVCAVVAGELRRLGLSGPAAWCDALAIDRKPSKREQDRLDAAICLLIAARWRFERGSCLMIGDLTHGYIVASVSPPTRERLCRAAASGAVPAR